LTYSAIIDFIQIFLRHSAGGFVVEALAGALPFTQFASGVQAPNANQAVSSPDTLRVILPVASTITRLHPRP
jgi:hypothetical protein